MPATTRRESSGNIPATRSSFCRLPSPCFYLLIACARRRAPSFLVKPRDVSRNVSFASCPQARTLPPTGYPPSGRDPAHQPSPVGVGACVLAQAGISRAHGCGAATCPALTELRSTAARSGVHVRLTLVTALVFGWSGLQLASRRRLAGGASVATWRRTTQTGSGSLECTRAC
jgi:hypothetical protein